METRKKLTARQRLARNKEAVNLEENIEQKEPAKLNLLILGYNNSLVSTEGVRDDLLSQSLVDHIRLTNTDPAYAYDAFVACTNRCYILSSKLALAWDKKAGQVNSHGKAYPVEQIRANISIGKITENLEKATGLSCLVVSSAEDEVTNKLGNGYASVLSPYEAFERKPAEHTYLTFEGLNKLGSSKNNQLLRIANFAVNQYPGAEIRMTFIDDNTTTCNQAFMAFCNPDQKKYSDIRLKVEPVALPEKVSLRIFIHAPKNNRSPFIRIPQGVEVPQANDAAFPQAASALQANSLFAGKKRKAEVKEEKQEAVAANRR